MLNRRKFRVLDIIDDSTRTNLQLDIDFSFQSRQVTRILDEIAPECGTNVADDANANIHDALGRESCELMALSNWRWATADYLPLGSAPLRGQ